MLEDRETMLKREWEQVQWERKREIQPVLGHPESHPTQTSRYHCEEYRVRPAEKRLLSMEAYCLFYPWSPERPLRRQLRHRPHQDRT